VQISPHFIPKLIPNIHNWFGFSLALLIIYNQLSVPN
jgi:hypothetical protein